ncbi:phosphatase PAP2 family protein [Novosphingobium sp. 9]|uniref:phosphatase PAP2 family protein n=1 Tax=Novosphingobium sp. 9 TaxID=2025349 RepID=UPI0021B6100A|nr:phosphatase PAP2 family protein [Novosphingobium sp. 9]
MQKGKPFRKIVFHSTGPYPFHAPSHIAAPLLSRKQAKLIAIVCWIAFAVIAAGIASNALIGFDVTGMLIWRDAHLLPTGPYALYGLAVSLTALGGVLLRSVITVAAALVLWRLKRGHAAVRFLLTVVSGSLFGLLVKFAVERPRPQIVPHLVHASGSSFPSGHSLNSALLYITMALVFGAFAQSRALRGGLVAGAVLLSLAIAWSRVWLGVHWPSDVVAGLLAGTAWAFGAAALFQKIDAAASPGGSKATAER